MTKSIIELSEAFVKSKFEQELPEAYSYHNFYHTKKVVGAVEKLADSSNLNQEDKEVLLISAYFHDLGFTIMPDNHETGSIELATQFLLDQHYDANRLEQVIKCIEATRSDWKGEYHLGKLMKDADLSGLADIHFSEVTEALRKEVSFIQKEKISKEDWRLVNIDFIQNHTYQSEAGIKLYKEGKIRNLKALQMKEKSEKTKKEPKLLTIGSSKSAQTQFKTALRNHIDLSSIADNKANIMLSVNALIITVALPLLIGEIQDLPVLTIPTAILALVSLTSMIFATLSTRPIKMSGITKNEDIPNKKSNLFFFGNYYKMNFNDYEESISKVVADDVLLDNSITRDLFFLGKSLGKKFEYLRLCYNFFMYGIAASVISFFIVILISK